MVRMSFHKPDTSDVFQVLKISMMYMSAYKMVPAPPLSVNGVCSAVNRNQSDAEYSRIDAPTSGQLTMTN